jgi:hypothetical protein
MPVNTAMTVDIMRVNDVRVDLFDTGGSPRWSDATLNREIDRAVERYSFVSPYLATSQIQSFPNSKLYAVPTLPCWWIHTVEFPLGTWPKTYVTYRERNSPFIANASSVGTVVINHNGLGGLSAGNYSWAITMVVPGGETIVSATSLTLAAQLNDSASLTGIPTGPYGVTARNVYRTKVGGNTYYLVGQITDNTSTSYTDLVSDTGLGAQSPSTNTTKDIAQFEMQLNNSQVPVDTTQWLELTYAQKHQMDTIGTTIPEKHWDAIALGAEAFAVQSYLANVADNFEYVDGQFRDRVDDTKSATFWRQYGNDLMMRFEARLLTIRNEATSLGPDIPQWGDKPVRWDRL